jgi:LysM repeat protein
MLRQIVLLLSFAIISFRANAALDSIGVENQNGKKNIIHKIEAKETYYSLARKYNVTPQSIIQFNENKSLQIGAIVKVPTDRSFIVPLETPVANNQSQTALINSNTIDYKVGPKEYLFVIARKFNTTVQNIKTLNNLRSDNLAIGQIIKVPIQNTVTEQIEVPIANTAITTDIETNNTNSSLDSIENASDRLKLPATRYGLREVSERGLAVVINDDNLDESKMMALHLLAPIGTVIKITNPMTGKSTFTKVVGKFTQNESTKDALILVNKATADLIGALDKRFQVNLIYGVPNE